MDDYVVDTRGIDKIKNNNLMIEMLCHNKTIFSESLNIYCNNEGKLYHNWKYYQDESLDKKSIETYCGKTCSGADLMNMPYFTSKWLSLGTTEKETQDKYIYGESVEIFCGKKDEAQANIADATQPLFSAICENGEWIFNNESEIDSSLCQKPTECYITENFLINKYNFNKQTKLNKNEVVEVNCLKDANVKLSATCLDNNLIKITSSLGEDSYDSCTKTKCTAANLFKEVYDNKMALENIECFENGSHTEAPCKLKCQKDFEWAVKEVSEIFVKCDKNVWIFMKNSDEKVDNFGQLCVPETCAGKHFTDPSGKTYPFNLMLDEYKKLCVDAINCVI